MTIQQIFCSVSDLIADMEKPGGDEARLLQAIREASNELEKEIGWFVPVTQTTKLRGNCTKELYPSQPVLALTGSVTNDDTALTLDTDFSFMKRAWANGPYLGMEVKYGGVIQQWSELDTDSVQIPCRTGFYERSLKTGATVADTTQQDATQETLKVSNGGKVSPGMSLLIGSEQELVTGWSTPTATVTLINGAITSATQTILTVDDAALLNVGEIIRLGFEQMRVNDKRDSTNQVFVARSWNNTQATTYADNTAVDVYRTVTVERALNGTTAAVHLIGVDVYRYAVPDDILLLTKQIATLIINKARGQYAGKSGNAETGEVFYHDIFPRYEIERIKQNYVIGNV